MRRSARRWRPSFASALCKIPPFFSFLFLLACGGVQHSGKEADYNRISWKAWLPETYHGSASPQALSRWHGRRRPHHTSILHTPCRYSTPLHLAGSPLEDGFRFAAHILPIHIPLLFGTTANGPMSFGRLLHFNTFVERPPDVEVSGRNRHPKGSDRRSTSRLYLGQSCTSGEYVAFCVATQALALSKVGALEPRYPPLRRTLPFNDGILDGDAVLAACRLSVGAWIPYDADEMANDG